MIGAVLVREPFRAMGTECAVAVTAGRAEAARARRALAAGRGEVEACERALSRFDERSDLSRLNRAGGAWVEIDQRLVEALRAAVRTREETGGRFDPTILPALVAAGYDRSFEQLAERPPSRVDGWRAGAAIEVDAGGARARIEAGAAVDLGGIGKGFAATRALWAMRDAWLELPGGLVDLGGDVAVWGEPPEGGAWRIAIADPRSPGAQLGTVEISDGAVATSGRDTRRFGPEGDLHHLIDPATGAPAAAGPLAATVVGLNAVDVEAYATALAVSPLAEAEGILGARPGLAAFLVPEEGDPVVVGALPIAEVIA
ncbi:MAG: FAD:protein FMN transferase [Gaiellaceae bacterium]